MKRKDIEKAANEAIKEHYNCNGKYPCAEREYCIFCNGKNTAFDCCECGADEFNNGFIAGADWRINSVWHNASEEPIVNPDDKGKCEFCIINLQNVYTWGWLYKNLKDNSFYFKTEDGEIYDMEEVKRYCYIGDLLPNT